MVGFGKQNEEFGNNLPFVTSLSDTLDNSLSIFIAPSVKLKEVRELCTEENPAVRSLLANACRICPDDNDMYKIIFTRYIMYQVRNESFFSGDDYEISQGRYLVLYERSRLLDHLCDITDCLKLDDGTYYPGRWKHYSICSENHIVDIISEYEPLINKKF